MILPEISGTSIVVSFFKYFCSGYRTLKLKIGYIYSCSQTCRLIKGFWKKIKICFKYSFLGRFTEIKEADTSILDNSFAVRYLTNFYKSWKNKTRCYLKASLVAKITEDTKEQLYFSPLRIAGIIGVIAVTVNMFLSIVFHRQISVWGWWMRGLFLFVAVCGLFCRTEWEVIKENSVLFKKLRT